MLNLSELVFKVNTTELVEAANKAAALGRAVEDLSSSFNKLGKTSSDASKAQAKVEKDLAAAEASKAKANKDNAQAEAIKSKALEKTTKATEDATTATKASVSILERQQTILEYQANGYSKGQSSILAYAKAAGVAASEIQEIGQVLQAQRTLMGGDPFDKSLGSLRSLQNEFRTLKEVQRLYTAEIPLTRKQMENLALDKLRLIEAMKTQGKTMSQIKAALKDLNAEYIATAANINRVVKAEDAIDKSYKDAANANAYLEKEMQRVNFALQAQNNELNKGTANALNRFEQNLKRSGLTLDQQRVKLEEYRKGLLSLEKTKGGNTDYITRALGPQITDIFVGLATGQAPLTVMLQQGGQLRDQFALAGVAAADMGATMRTAAKDMVVSVAAVARAFGDLLLGAFIDTGKGIVNLIGRVTGLTAALELARYQLTLFAMADGTFGGPLLKMFNMLRVAVIGFAAAAATTGVAALIALAVGFTQVVKENNALAKSLALSGGSLAISHATTMDYVRTLGDMGVTTGTATEALVAMAKAGVFTKDEILLVGNAAAQMATYADIAVEDTVKAFAKLKEKPVEALTDIAKSTGMVSIETLKMVQELQKAGKETEAAALAMQTYGDVSKQQVDQMKANYNGFSLYVMELGRTIKQFFSDIFKDLFLVSTEGMERELQGIETKLAKLDKNGGIFGGDVFGYNKEALLARQTELQGTLNLMKAQNAALEDQMKVNTANAKGFEDVNKVMKDVNSTIDKAAVKTLSLTDYTKKYVEERKKLIGSAVFDPAQLAQMEKAAKIEWESAQKKPKGDKKENYYATLMRDATNSTIKADEATQNLTKSQIKMLEVIADPRFSKLTEQQKSNYLATMAVASAQEQQNRSQDLYNKLLGKSEGLGSDYYNQLKLIEEAAATGFDPKKVEEMRVALEATTPAAKAIAKYNEDSAHNLVKYKEAAQQSLDASKIEAQNLQNKAALIGLSAGQQKLLTIEQQKQLELTAADFKLRKELVNIDETVRQGKMKPEDGNTARVEAERATAAEIVNINTNAVLDIKTAWQGVFDDISGGSVNRFAESLRDAGNISFANVISSVDKLSASMTSLVDTQLIYNAAKEAAKGDTVKLAAIDKQHALAQINSYANITGAMKGFFKEGSKGYKTIQTAEKLFRSYEAAMAIKNAALKIGLQLQEIAATAAAQTTLTSITATGEAARNAIKIPGVFTAFMSMLGPWGIPAAIAALAAVGLATSGGSAKVPTTNQGTGTVFGDPEAKSESIKNSLDILKDVNTLTMHYSEKMLSSLRSIENLMGGVTNLILRSAGIDAAASGITEGTKLPGAFDLGIVSKLPIAGKLLGKLFGTKTTITGQGVYAEDTKLNDVMSSGIESGYYVDVNKKKSFAGFTYSNKNSTNKTIDDQLSKQFTLIIKNFFDVIKSAAPVLGFTTDQIDSNLKDFVVKIGKIDLKGLSGKEIQEKLNAVFGAAGDDMAKAALPGFERFQQVGEGYLETVVRVAYATESLRGMMDTLGVSTVLTVDSAMGLVDTFGDLENAMDKLGAYYDAFYTEAEKEATIRRQLNTEFKRNNLELPKTREEYRKLVEAQDLTTEEGRKMYAWLITLAPAFAKVTTSAEDLARQAKELADKAKEAFAKSLEDAYAALEKAVKAQIAILKEQETAQTTVVNNLKSIFDLLKKNVRELYMQVDSTSGMLASQGRSLITNALAGGAMPDLDTLTNAISAVRSEIEGANYTSQFDADKARLQFAADLSKLQDKAEDQLSTEELILKAIKDSIKYYENILIEARKQVDAILGVTDAVLTVAEALANLTSLMFQDIGDTRPTKAPGSEAVWGGSNPGTSGSVVKDSKYKQVTSLGTAGVGYIPITDTSYISKLDSLNDIYHSFDGTGNLAGLLDAIKAAGGDLADLSALSGYFESDWEKAANSVGKQFATGGAFTNGIVKRPTSFNIGEMGEAGPEAIMPLTNVGGRLGVSVSGSDSSSALADRVASLEFALQAIAVNTGKMARILDAAQGEDGRSIMTSDAPTT